MQQESRHKKVLQIHHLDNIAVACEQLEKGGTVLPGEQRIAIKEPIALAHKFALASIQKGEKIIKYGVAIGSATRAISSGEHVHLHNMKSDYIPTFQKQKDASGHQKDISCLH